MVKLARGWQLAALTVVVSLSLAGCAAAPIVAEGLRTPVPSAPVPHGSSEETPATSAARGATIGTTFVAVIDGDTIDTAAGRVRIIGIDTPERSECGYDEASMAIGQVLAVGDPVTLELPEGQNDADRYQRLLRFVMTDGGVDLGLMQLEAGHALARYDSRDGYPAHPREASYHAAQIATQGANRTVVTAGCRDAALAPPPVFTPPAFTPPANTPPVGEERWWAQYPSCSALKKNLVGHPTGPFSRADPEQLEIYEWFAFGAGNRGDGDGDGLACEGW